MSSTMQDLEKALQAKTAAIPNAAAPVPPPAGQTDSPLGELETVLQKKQPPPGNTPSEAFTAIDPSFDTSKDKLNYYQQVDQEITNPIDKVLYKTPVVGAALMSGANVLGSALKAPGNAVEAHAMQDTGRPFEKSWSSPISSAAVAVKDYLAGDHGEFKQLEGTPWYDKFGGGVGAGLTYLGSGGAGKALGLSPAITMAALGTAQGANDQYEEALRMGADPEQASLAYTGGGLVGAASSIPGGYFLGRLNKLTGGQVLQRIKDFGMSQNPGLLTDMLKGFLVAGGTAGAQQIGNNWVASDLAGYDPHRSLGENFWDSVTTNGVVGSIFGLGHHMLDRAQTSKALDDLDGRYNAAMASGDPINLLGGPTAAVPENMLALRQMKQEAMDKLSETGNEQLTLNPDGTIKAGNGFGEEPAPDLISTINQDSSTAVKGIRYDLVKKTLDPLLDKPVNTSIETALSKNPDGSPLTIRQALTHTPVVAAGQSIYSDMIKITDRQIMNIEGMLAHPDVINTDKISIKGLQSQLKQLKDNSLALKQKQVLANQALAEAKNYVAAFREAVLDPNMKFIIQDFPIGNEAANGSYRMNFAVPLADGQLHNVSNLFLNLDDIATEAYYAKQLKENSLAVVKRKIFETINHELGHAVAISNLKKVYDTAKNRNNNPVDRLDAYKTIAWMDREYGTWLKKMEQSPQIEFLNTGVAPTRAIQMGSLPTNETSPTGEPVPAGEVMQNRSMQEDFPMGSSGKDSQQFKNYLLSFDEFWAEMTARMATQGKLATGFDGTTPVDPVITKFFEPVLAQYKKMFEQMPQFAKNEYANNWETFVKSQMIGNKLEQMQADAGGAGGKDIIDALNGKLPGFDPKNFAGVKEYRDKFTKIMKSGFTILQIADQNPHILHLQNYIKGLNTWQSYQRDKQVSIVDTLNDWKNLGRAEAAILSRTLLEESEAGRRFDIKELAAKLNGESLLVYQKVRSELDKVLDEMRQVSILDATKNFYDNSEMLKQEIDSINTEFDKMASKGYFPFMRFGKFTMKVKALEDMEFGGESYKKGQLISFPAFESEKERDQVYSNTKKMLGSKAAVTASTFSDENLILQGIPTSLLRTLKSKLENSGALTNEQTKAIDEAIESVSPSGKFLKHFRKRQGIHGYSEDSMRSFAMYSRNATGHLAKVKYADMLREPIAGMKEDVKIIGSYGGYAQARQQMADWMDRHFNYVMQPANELAALRSAGFVAALGFNIKSAAVNATQPFTTTLPYLSARYGDINAIKHMGGAMNTLKDWVLNKKAYVDALPDEQGKVQKADDRRARIGMMITKLLHEGQIDQSLATELSIAASENNLDRGLYMPSYRRFWHETSRYSALPFHLVEKMNRYITSIAAYNADYEKYGDHEKAVTAARQANWSANFENARWNRPEFMRGKKSAALLFASYTQNTLYFATHDKGAVRWWLGMLLLGGIMGLPFAKNLEDLVDAAITEVNSLLGVRDPKNSLRVELRKHLEDLHANPDLVLHGLSQDSFGFGQLGELTGVPIPHFDLSSSIGMGQILPGTQIPALIQNGGDANKVFREGIVQAAGAGGNLVDQFYSGLMSNSPDTWKKVESMLPMMSARSISKAVRMGVRGKEQMADGTMVADFDMSDLRDQLTLVGQGLGFTPSKVTQGYEREITKKDMVQYYKTQQAALLQQHNWAILNEDRESVADVRKKILEYNSNVPYPEMGITAKTLKDSAKSYIKKQIINGAGVTADRKYNRLQKYVEDAYPNPVPDKLEKE